MFNYFAFGLNISSELKLPGVLETGTSEKADVTISHGIVNEKEENSQKKRILQWEDIGQIKITDGEEIIVDPAGDQIIPFILGPAMAVLLHQRGFLVLHGSSVKIKNHAIAFLGYRGFGKTTTAINLYLNGYPLVTDDLLAIRFDQDNEPIVYPGYTHVRLTDESYNDIKDRTHILTPVRTIVGKAFCDASKDFSKEPLKLKRIYILSHGDDIQVHSLTAQDNLIDIIRHSMATQIFTNNEQAEHLIQSGKLINNVSVKGLNVDHSVKNVSKLIKIIEEDVSNFTE